MRKILVHVGPWKTGTTAIQKFLVEAQSELNSAGFIYCPDSGDNHQLLANSLYASPSPDLPQPPATSEWLAGVPPELAPIFSSEDFSKASSEKVAAWRASLEQHEVIVLLAIREPVNWLLSWYRQLLRGFPINFGEMLDRDGYLYKTLVEPLFLSSLHRRWYSPGVQFRVWVVGDESDSVADFVSLAELHGIRSDLRARDNQGWPWEESLYTGKYLQHSFEYVEQMVWPQNPCMACFHHFLGEHTQSARPMHEYSRITTSAELIEVGALTEDYPPELIRWRSEWLEDARRTLDQASWSVGQATTDALANFATVDAHHQVIPSSDCLDRLPVDSHFEAICRIMAVAFVKRVVSNRCLHAGLADEWR